MRVSNKTRKILLASTLICLTNITDAAQVAADVEAVMQGVTQVVRAVPLPMAPIVEDVGCMPTNHLRLVTPPTDEGYVIPILVGEITLHVLLTPLLATPLLYGLRTIAEWYGRERI